MKLLKWANDLSSDFFLSFFFLPTCIRPYFSQHVCSNHSGVGQCVWISKIAFYQEEALINCYVSVLLPGLSLWHVVLSNSVVFSAFGPKSLSGRISDSKLYWYPTIVLHLYGFQTFSLALSKAQRFDYVFPAIFCSQKKKKLRHNPLNPIVHFWLHHISHWAEMIVFVGFVGIHESHGWPKGR